MFRYFLLGTLAVTGLVLATATPAQAWGRRPASTYVPGYGWTYPSSPALYGYAPYGYYADYGTYFRGVPRDGSGSYGHAYPGAAQSGYGFSNYGFGAYSGTSGYPSIGYNGLDGAPALPAGYGAGK